MAPWEIGEKEKEFGSSYPAMKEYVGIFSSRP